MRTQKFNHMKGGKILGSFLILLTFGLFFVIYLLFTEKSVDFISTIFLLCTTGTIVWVVYKFYKPSFSEVIFSDTNIVSKTHFETETLNLEDIKGIWFLTDPHEQSSIEIYSQDNKPPKNSMVIIGDIEYFEGAQYFGLNMAATLHDSFSNGYTAINYRKELDEVLDYYFRKIKERKPFTDSDTDNSI